MTLGSRRNLCTNPDVKALKSDTRINDACLDLNQSKSKSKSKTKSRVAAKSGGAAAAAEDEDGDEDRNALDDGRDSGKKRRLDGTEGGGPRKKGGGVKSRNTGCPFKDMSGAVADMALAEVRDIEEIVTSAKEAGACAYYGTRQAATMAQLVVMPYTAMIHKPTRESLGISLKGHVVVFDEAHNIIETINATHSVQVTASQVKAAANQVVSNPLDEATCAP